MNKTLCKKLDSAHSRLFRYALNIHWNQHIRNDQIFQGLIPLSKQSQNRRLIFAGHCWRSGKSPLTMHAVQPVSDMLFWRAPLPYKPGRRSNYLNILLDESIYIPSVCSPLKTRRSHTDSEEYAIETLKTFMEDRDAWRKHIKKITF